MDNEISELSETTAGDSKNPCSLFIGNLSRYCKESHLMEAFAPYDVVEANIKVMKGSRLPLGYGFLFFPTYEAALRCKAECNGMIVNGRHVKLSWAQRNTKLIITNLDISITRDRLHEMFHKYGIIDESSTQLAIGDNSATAIVEFEQRGCAEKAKQDTNGKRPESSRVRADWYTGSSLAQDNAEDDIISVYFKYETPIPDKLVDEVCISRVFSVYGSVLDVSIKGSFVTQIGMQEGYGFVHFENSPEGKAAALAAIEGLQGQAVEGVSFTAEASKNLVKSLHDDNPGGDGGDDPTDESNMSREMPSNRGHTSTSKQNVTPAPFEHNEFDSGDVVFEDFDNSFQNMHVYVGSPHTHPSTRGPHNPMHGQGGVQHSTGGGYPYTGGLMYGFGQSISLPTAPPITYGARMSPERGAFVAPPPPSYGPPYVHGGMPPRPGSPSYTPDAMFAYIQQQQHHSLFSSSPFGSPRYASPHQSPHPRDSERGFFGGRNRQHSPFQSPRYGSPKSGSPFGSPRHMSPVHQGRSSGNVSPVYGRRGSPAAGGSPYGGSPYGSPYPTPVMMVPVDMSSAYTAPMPQMVQVSEGMYTTHYPGQMSAYGAPIMQPYHTGTMSQFGPGLLNSDPNMVYQMGPQTGQYEGPQMSYPQQQQRVPNRNLSPQGFGNAQTSNRRTAYSSPEAKRNGSDKPV